MSIAVLVLAAGASRRMRGRDKLLEPIGGIPLLTRVCTRALAVSDHVLVALPAGHERRQALKGLGVEIVTVPNPQNGMSASIGAGLANVPETAKGVMILPADMPDLTVQDLVEVAEGFEQSAQITRGYCADGTPGHPVVFPRTLFSALQDLTGDTGARHLLQDQSVRRVVLPDRHAITDLDTPEDWDAWRAASGR